MTVVAPIDRLNAILRLDMPAAVSRSSGCCRLSFFSVFGL
jgi:hypothetical protein